LRTPIRRLPGTVDLFPYPGEATSSAAGPTKSTKPSSLVFSPGVSEPKIKLGRRM